MRLIAARTQRQMSSEVGVVFAKNIFFKKHRIVQVKEIFCWFVKDGQYDFFGSPKMRIYPFNKSPTIHYSDLKGGWDIYSASDATLCTVDIKVNILPCVSFIIQSLSFLLPTTNC